VITSGIERERYVCMYVNTFHSRLIPKGVAEVSQIFLRDAHVLPKLLRYDSSLLHTADMTGDKSIAVCSQSISGASAVNPLAAFYDIHGRKRGAILLFCPGHHTVNVVKRLKD
jgi:hypothetical protein